MVSAEWQKEMQLEKRIAELEAKLKRYEDGSNKPSKFGTNWKMYSISLELQMERLEVKCKRYEDALDKIVSFTLALPSSQLKGNILHIINKALESEE